jgi:cell division protein ZipA
MDADTLRILLAVLGAFVIGGLYLWERSRGGGEDSRSEREAGAGERDGKREPSLGPGEGDASRQRHAGGAGEAQPELVLEPPPSPAQEAGEAAPPGPMILTVHVLAPGEPFSGADIVHVAGHCGLEPGEMEIFHCYLGDEEHRQTLFSMANMVKPGTFPFGNMAEFQSPGLTLFAQLDGTADDPGRMEELLGTAHALAEELDGELCDERRSPLSAAAEDRLRERIMDFVGARLAASPE